LCFIFISNTPSVGFERTPALPSWLGSEGPGAPPAADADPKRFTLLPEAPGRDAAAPLRRMELVDDTTSLSVPRSRSEQQRGYATGDADDGPKRTVYDSELPRTRLVESRLISRAHAVASPTSHTRLLQTASGR
jgi:hypothetical protein